MLARRPVRRPPWAALPILAALVFALVAPPPGTAHAGESALDWPFEWRPNWLPGDPPPPAFGTTDMAASGSPAPGLIVALDPITRRPVMPTEEQRRALTAHLEDAGGPLAPAEPLRAELLPGGGEILHLNGQFQVFSLARRDATGRFVTDCADDVAAALRLLTQPPPAQLRREER